MLANKPCLSHVLEVIVRTYYVYVPTYYLYIHTIHTVVCSANHYDQPQLKAKLAVERLRRGRPYPLSQGCRHLSQNYEKKILEQNLLSSPINSLLVPRATLLSLLSATPLYSQSSRPTPKQKAGVSGRIIKSSLSEDDYLSPLFNISRSYAHQLLLRPNPLV